MGKTNLKVKLLSHTPLPAEVVAMGARICYSSADVETLSQGVSEKDQTKYLQRIVDMGHLSPIEHASFTFAIEGVSRALLAQITRHRIASFSVQSQRYVSQAKQEGCFSYILPPAIEALGPEAVEEYDRQMCTMQQWYNQWQEKLGCALCAAQCVRNAHGGNDECKGADALFLPALLQPGAMGNPRAGVGDVKTMPAGGAGAV